MTIPWLTAIGLLGQIVTLAAAEPGEFRPPAPRPDRARPGPWDNDVWVYRVPTNSAPVKVATFSRAGVPTLARFQDGRLIAAFQYFPQDDDRAFDRVAVCFSSDEGNTWTQPRSISIEGMEKGLARPFDPTLVPLSDGRIRIYFTSNRSPDFRRSIPSIYSAISSNGVDYAFEPGVRFGIEDRVVIDCAVALHQGVFHLIVPDNGTAEDFVGAPQRGAPPPGGNGYHAVSTNGLDFSRESDLKLPTQRHRWLGNMQSDAGRIIFFGTGDGGIWSGASPTGETWKLEGKPLRVPGADPGAVRLRDGGWLLAVTGPPRPGTPSDRRRGDGHVPK